jgi:hypothetical protein
MYFGRLCQDDMKWFKFALALRKEHRPRVFENRELGTERDDVTGGWITLYNEYLRNVCSS